MLSEMLKFSPLRTCQLTFVGLLVAGVEIVHAGVDLLATVLEPELTGKLFLDGGLRAKETILFGTCDVAQCFVSAFKATLIFL